MSKRLQFLTTENEQQPSALYLKYELRIGLLIYRKIKLEAKLEISI